MVILGFMFRYLTDSVFKFSSFLKIHQCCFSIMSKKTREFSHLFAHHEFFHQFFPAALFRILKSCISLHFRPFSPVSQCLWQGGKFFAFRIPLGLALGVPYRGG